MEEKSMCFPMHFRSRDNMLTCLIYKNRFIINNLFVPLHRYSILVRHIYQVSIPVKNSDISDRLFVIVLVSVKVGYFDTCIHFY